MLEKIKQWYEKKADIIKLIISAIFIAVIPCIKIDFAVYAYNQSIHPVIACATRFGNDVEYMMTINGSVIYYPFFVVLVYTTLLLLNKYLFTDKLDISIGIINIIAVLMGIGRIIGESYYYVVSWDLIKNAALMNVILLIGYIALFRAIILTLYTVICKFNRCFSAINFGAISYRKAILFLTFFIAWIPRFILMYPIHMEVDTVTILRDAISGDYNTGYLIQTYIFKILANLGRYIGLKNALYIYLAGVFAIAVLFWTHVFTYFGEKLKYNMIWIITLGMMIVFPNYQMWSIYVAKDVQFGLAETMLVYLLFIMLFDKDTFCNKRFFYILWFVITLIAVFSFRKNGIFDIIATVIVLLFITNKDFFVHIWKIKKVGLVLSLLIGIACLCVAFVVIKSNEKDNQGLVNPLYTLFIYPWEYYGERISYSFFADALTRNAVAIQKGMTPEMEEIIGDSLEEYKTSIYTSMEPTNYVSILRGLNGNQVKQLTKYLLQEEPALLLQANIANRYSFFDVGRWVYDSEMVQILDGPIFLAYDETAEIYYEIVKNEDRFSFLNDGYRAIENIWLVRMLSNIATTVWSLIVLLYVGIKKGTSKFLIVYTPLIMCFIGNLLSGYNAVPRLCVPLLLSCPIVLMMCCSIDSEKRFVSDMV